jgi:hypothetical protein
MYPELGEVADTVRSYLDGRPTNLIKACEQVMAEHDYTDSEAAMELSRQLANGVPWHHALLDETRPDRSSGHDGLPRREVFRMIVIDLHVPTITCCICGATDLSKWGVPIDADTALIAPNDFEGDWGAKPVCRDCWKRHDEGEFVGHDPAY